MWTEVYIYGCLACLSVCASLLCLERIKEGIDPLQLKLQRVVSRLCGCWESNPRLLEEQPVLLGTGPSLGPLEAVFIRKEAQSIRSDRKASSLGPQKTTPELTGEPLI